MLDRTDQIGIERTEDGDHDKTLDRPQRAATLSAPAAGFNWLPAGDPPAQGAASTMERWRSAERLSV
jgi:hypothetical protein